MTLANEASIYSQNPSPRRERRISNVPKLERSRPPQSYMRGYLDSLVRDGEFDLAHDTVEYYFRNHEGTVSDQLFSVAMQSISLPYHRWMRSEQHMLTGEQRQYAYRTSVNLATLALEYHGTSSATAQKIRTRGIASETLFYVAATRLMSAGNNLPLVITPAPLSMDASSSRHGVAREGVDFIAYYHDFTVPIQVKTTSKREQGYRPEILVIALDQIAAPEDHTHTQLLESYQREVKDETPHRTACNAQDRLYNKLQQHVATQEGALLRDNIALY